MPLHSRIAFALALLFAAGLAAAQSGTPADAYQRVVAVTRKAKSWQPILPLLSAQYQSDIRAQDAEGQKSFLAYFKSSLAHRKLQIFHQAVDGDTAVIEARAVDGAGKPAAGRIEMVREGGAWKLHDHGWSAPQ